MASTQPGIVLRHLRQIVTAEEARTVTDQLLLERFARDCDGTAFEALVHRYGPLVHGVCRRVLYHWQDAEDAFQATFLILARKAGAISKRSSVGSWLYQVAYRMARRARDQAQARQRREAKALVRQAADPLSEVTGRELLAVLDEEIQNLPEAQRASLVLCYLDGKTRDQAARQLGCSVGTVKRRLERAKVRLHARLARRGLTLSAALLSAVLGQRTAAAVPGGMPAATVKAAMAVTAGNFSAAVACSPSAAVLADGLLRTTMAAKLEFVAVCTLAILVTVLGAGVWTRNVLLPGETAHAFELTTASSEPAEAQPGPTPAEKQTAPAATPLRPTAANKKEMTVTGRVLDPVGKGVAGAQVAIMVQTHQPARAGEWPEEREERLALTKTDAAGRFQMHVRRTSSRTEYQVNVIAAGVGYGLGWQALHPDAKPSEVVIHLHSEQTLRGRLIGLEGQAAARVRVYLAYLAQKNSPGTNGVGWMEPHENWTPWPAPVTTDELGRFTFRGLGRGQLVGLHVQDDRYARQTLRRIDTGDTAQTPEVTLLLAPSQVVEGRVVTEDTGQPVPHARLIVKGQTRKPDGPTFEHGQVAQRADADGRFRISSFPGNTVLVTALPPQTRLTCRCKRHWPGPRPLSSRRSTWPYLAGCACGARSQNWRPASRWPGPT
jgi:RNA polymerase sigma factor (sigma-70 family)